MAANLTFLLGYCHYVRRMSVLYFKNDEARFQEQIFTLQMILTIHVDWSKAQIIDISAQRPKMKEIRVLYFLEL